MDAFVSFHRSDREFVRRFGEVISLHVGGDEPAPVTGARRAIDADVDAAWREAISKISPELILTGRSRTVFQLHGDLRPDAKIVLLDSGLFESAEAQPDIDEAPTAASQPPASVALLTSLFVVLKYRHEMIGDLLEEFPEVVTHRGTTRARLWFCKQVARSVWATVGPAVERLVGWSAAAAFVNRLLS